MDQIQTANPHFFLRFAVPDEAEEVVAYVRKLGTYQKMLPGVTVTTETMRQLLSSGKGEVLWGLYQGRKEAFLYFFENSSAFIGATGLYIDTFYVNEQLRGQGLGEILLSYVSKLAVERGCRRLEWGCLEWNQPAISFYEQFGAQPVSTMRIYRFTPEKLEKMAARFSG